MTLSSDPAGKTPSAGASAADALPIDPTSIPADPTSNPAAGDSPQPARSVHHSTFGPLAHLRLPRIHIHRAVRNANQIHQEGLSRLDKLALVVTDKVGSMQFFLIILGWTILWCSYNILASEVPALHWHPFDPFPAFVAYLLVSNVIQILLMPLIMVGQNVQSRHSEIRAELDFEINQKAEKEVIAILRHLEHNTDLLIKLMQHLNCQMTDEELKDLSLEMESLKGLTAPVG